MNQFVEQVGGMPHYQNDLSFIQRGLAAAVVGLAQVYGPNVILHGVEPEGGRLYVRMGVASR